MKPMRTYTAFINDEQCSVTKLNIADVEKVIQNIFWRYCFQN